MTPATAPAASVSLVKDPRTRCRYALKIVSKKKLLASKPQTRTKWIMREKHVMEALMPPPATSCHRDLILDSESVKDSFVRLAAEGVSGPPISAEDEEQYGHVWQAFGAPSG